jgi:archaellin
MHNDFYPTNGLIPATLRDQRGIGGLETAIVLIAFVVVSLVFAFAALTTGLFSSDRVEQMYRAGLSEARGSIEVRGGIKVEATKTSKSLTTVTAEAVGTGDGVDTSFTLASSPVHSKSETIYVAAVAKTRDTDYTINFDTGAITFTSAPANSSAITADYKYGHDAVGTAATSTTSFTLNNSPIVGGGGLTVYLDGVAKTLGSGYTVDYNTGKVTFNSAPGNGVRFDATYTYYSLDNVVITISNAAGSDPVDFTGGKTVIEYLDPDTADSNITSYTLTKLGSADADNLLESTELFEIRVDVSTYGLTNDDVFTINVLPAGGAVLVLNRTVPAEIGSRIDVG